MSVIPHRKRPLPPELLTERRAKLFKTDDFGLQALIEPEWRNIRAKVLSLLLPSFWEIFRFGARPGLRIIQGLREVCKAFRETVDELVYALVHSELPPLVDNTFFFSHGGVFSMLLAFCSKRDAVRQLVEKLSSSAGMSFFTMEDPNSDPLLLEKKEEINHDAILVNYLVDKKPQLSVPWIVSVLYYYLQKERWIFNITVVDGKENPDVEFLLQLRDLSWYSKLGDYIHLLENLLYNHKWNDTKKVLTLMMNQLDEIGRRIALCIRNPEIKRILLTMVCEILIQISVNCKDPADVQSELGKKSTILCETRKIIRNMTLQIVCNCNSEDFLLWMDIIFYFDSVPELVAESKDGSTILSKAFMETFSTSVAHPTIYDKTLIIFFKIDNIYVYNFIYQALQVHKGEGECSHVKDLERFLTGERAMKFALSLPTLQQKMDHIEFLLSIDGRQYFVVRYLLWQAVIELKRLIFDCEDPTNNLQEFPLVSLILMLEELAGLREEDTSLFPQPHFGTKFNLAPVIPKNKKDWWGKLITAMDDWTEVLRISKKLSGPHRYEIPHFIFYIKRVENIFMKYLPLLMNSRPNAFKTDQTFLDNEGQSKPTKRHSRKRLK